MTTLLVVLGALFVAVIGGAILDPLPPRTSKEETEDPIIAPACAEPARRRGERISVQRTRAMMLHARDCLVSHRQQNAD
jgi:hypothetical protein